MHLREFLSQLGLESDLQKLLAETVPAAIIRIRELVETDHSEKAGTENASGEKQIAADVMSDNALFEVLKNSGVVSSYVSEKTEGLVETGFDGKFTVVSDPLDGSSLADVNLSVGTIIGIYDAGDPVGKTPRQMRAACYAVYGPRTTLVIAPGEGKGAHEFVLGMDSLFYLQREHLRVSEEAKYFAPGNLRACVERKDYLKLLDYWAENKYTLRYSGGMVPDVNHILIKGSGVFAYPSYSEAPEGKLRLLFEVGPMSYVMGAAGGAATDGHQNVLDKKITAHHQRTPIFIGSKSEVKRCEEFLAG